MSDKHSSSTVHIYIALVWAEVSYADLWAWTRLAPRIPHHPFEAHYRIYYSRTIHFYITATMDTILVLQVHQSSVSSQDNM
jgi:hypothetical protein